MRELLRRALASSVVAALLAASAPAEAWAQVRVRAAAPAAQAGSAAAAVRVPGALRSGLSALRPAAALAPALSGPSIGAAPSLRPGASAASELGRPGSAAAASAPAVAAPSLAKPSEAKAEAVREAGSAVAPASAARGAALLETRGAELRAAFGTRAPETLSAAGRSALDAGARPLAASDEAKPESEGAAPPPAPQQPDGEGKVGLGRTASLFIAALLIAQVGVETLAVGMPVVAQRVFSDVTVIAQLGIFASIANVTGRQFATLVIERFGLRKTYLFGTSFRLLSISAIITLLATGQMTLPLMMLFYSVNGLIGGITSTAESSIPPALVGQDQAKIEKFWTVEQTLLEIVGFAAPIVAGTALASMGAVSVLSVFPLTFAIALAILYKTLRIPAKLNGMRLADEQGGAKGPSKTPKAVLADFFRRVAHGAKIVWNDPKLKYAFLGYTAYSLLNPFLYSMIAPAYGLRLVGPELMGGVAGMLTGLYSLGGLFGGLMMLKEQKRHKALLAENKITKEGVNEELRKSMLKWMLWGIAGLAAIPTFVLSLAPWYVAGVAITVPALALIPYGIAQVVSIVKLRSYFQSQAPEKDMPAAMGFFGAASLGASTAGLLALKYLFKGMAGFGPFWVIAAAMIPLGVYYLYLQRKLAGASSKK